MSRSATSPDLVLLQLRLDPAHARGAGYQVRFAPCSTVCDICGGRPIARRVQRRPVPLALSGDTIVYYPAEWAFCAGCYALRDDEDALCDRTPDVRHLPEPERTVAAAQMVHAVLAWRHSGQPYRPRGQALAALRRSVAVAGTARVGPGVTHVDLTEPPAA